MKSFACAAVVLALLVIGSLENVKSDTNNICEGKDNVYFPDPASCAKFIQCSNGQAYEMNCAEGAPCFNPDKNVCDFADGCKCSNPTTTEQPTTPTTEPTVAP